ncbi:hypothetical protein GGS23DRAFT_331058 [Durotheca rogersii]|uniref:uncharacterized protein n=1 Tax=Durotheca rogersii TaxID=419775 RepID=UPI00221F6B3C|nr:uncharacterized protein GGS23DRAFT_331058 [Durotheca rogersii]KAI5859313.1 hypothetical protein GGS23DRAFT_331058 [Durotheca rogersii]
MDHTLNPTPGPSVSQPRSGVAPGGRDQGMLPPSPGGIQMATATSLYRPLQATRGRSESVAAGASGGAPAPTRAGPGNTTLPVPADGTRAIGWLKLTDDTARVETLRPHRAQADDQIQPLEKKTGELLPFGRQAGGAQAPGQPVASASRSRVPDRRSKSPPAMRPRTGRDLRESADDAPPASLLSSSLSAIVWQGGRFDNPIDSPLIRARELQLSGYGRKHPPSLSFPSSSRVSVPGPQDHRTGDRTNSCRDLPQRFDSSCSRLHRPKRSFALSGTRSGPRTASTRNLLIWHTPRRERSSCFSRLHTRADFKATFVPSTSTSPSPAPFPFLPLFP